MHSIFEVFNEQVYLHVQYSIYSLKFMSQNVNITSLLLRLILTHKYKHKNTYNKYNVRQPSRNLHNHGIRYNHETVIKFQLKINLKI